MSDKLREAIERAERESLPNKAKEKAKEKAKSTAKKKAKDVAKKGTKKAVKGAHKALMKNSKTYAKAAKAVARGLSAIKNTKVAALAAKTAALAGKALAFLVTPIAGWVVSAILILLIVVVLFSDGDDTVDTIDDMIVTADDTEQTESVEWTFSSKETEEVYYYYAEEDIVCSPITYSPVISDESYASGEWTEEGSTAYNNAKLIFDTWVDAGLSGAAAAGIVGWINTEGGFHMFGRAEGHYASNDPEEASLAYGNLPTFRPNYPTGSNGEQQGGGGVYQFTPYDKYAPLGSPDWEDPVKMHDYLFSVFRDELTSSAWIPQGGNDMTGEETSFEDFAQETDPERATLMWNAYERANQDHVDPEQKKSDARFAYEAFGGANYTFDAERFEATFGERADDYVHTARDAVYDPCNPSMRPGGSWRGAGGQPTITGGMWTHPRSPAIGRESIPDELREYALDPESVGLISGDRMSWINKWSAGISDGGQCTHLTSNLAERLWEKDGVPIHNKAGNGRAVVGNFAAKYGADGESTTPTGGAIFSTPEGSAVDSNGQTYGHTGIVSHVFDNGDFLVVETNMGGYSGDAIGKPYTYSYRYITRQEAIDGSFTFYDPSKVGFKLVPGIKSL